MRAELADPIAPTKSSSADVIETVGLTKEFKGFVAVKNVNLKNQAEHCSFPDRPEWGGENHLL